MKGDKLVMGIFVMLVIAFGIFIASLVIRGEHEQDRCREHGLVVKPPTSDDWVCVDRDGRLVTP